MVKLIALSICLTTGAAIGLNMAGVVRSAEPIAARWEPSHKAVPYFTAPTLNAEGVHETLDTHANSVHNERGAGLPHLPRLVCGPFLPMLGRVNGRPNPFYGNVQRCEALDI